ncbi:MAG: transporter [Phycisphaerales bacterium]|nr:transporter [Phycisphaerales bacterium]
MIPNPFRHVLAHAIALHAAAGAQTPSPQSTISPPPAAQEPAPAAAPQGRLPDYEHIHSTDVWRRDSFWFTDRQSLVDDPIKDAWDPLKLINTDRPDYTDVAAVVGDGVVQIETGFSQRRRRVDGVRTVTEAVPNALFRIGHGERFEYRIKVRGDVRNEVTDVATGDRAVAGGFGDVELGFKWVLGRQNDWLPMQTIVARAFVPTGEEDVSARRVEPGLSYIYNWQVRRWWFVRGNTGVDLAHQPTYLLQASAPGGSPTVDVEHDGYLEWSQSLSSYMQISKRLGMFAEWFMFKRHGSEDDHSDHLHNYGLYVYLTPDMQIDLRAGWRIGDHLDEALYGVGFSVRF